MPELHYGMPMKDALEAARALGFDVYQPHANGEWMLRKGGVPTIRVNGRRKDASKFLVAKLRTLSRRCQLSKR